MSSPADTPVEPVTSGTPLVTSPGAGKRWRRRLKRTVKLLLILLLVAYTVVWWTTLRIQMRTVWPVPADASQANDAINTTAEFLQRKNPSLADLGIPLAAAPITDPQFFLDGSTFFPPMLADIRGARHSVNMQMFGIRPGDVADEFVAALVERSRAGVQVRLIVDRFGSAVDDKSSSLFAKLEEAGVEVVANDAFPLDRDGPLNHLSIDWRHDELGQVDHRKTMVVDGNIGWIGGAGLEDHFRNGSFTDVFMRFQGPAVHQLQVVFLTSFDVYGGILPTSKAELAPFFPTIASSGPADSWVVQNLIDGYLAGTEASRDVIRSATERLDIMNPYFTDAGFMDDIIAAANRGVHVRLVVSRDSNVAQATYALESRYGDLMRAGIEIWEHPGTMHAKVTIADDQVIVGTINYDAWGLYRNLEIAMLIDDSVVADEAVARLVDPSVAASVAATNDFSAYEAARNWFWARLSYFI